MWLVAGGLAVMLWSRSRFKKQDGVFPTKMRLESGSAPGIGKKWPPMSSFALWVHDVLLVHKGLGLMSTSPLGVAAVEASAEGVDPEEVKRLGENPVILRFRLDNGAVLQVAAPGDALELAQGPFSTSEAQGLNRG
jgi:hypothetical protein